MKTKEEVESIRRRINNLWETIHNCSGPAAYEYAGLMNYLISQSHQIRSFYEKGQMDKVDEIYSSSIKVIDEAEAVIRKHNLF